MGLAGGLNLYQYGEGNPLSFIDPFGLCPQSPLQRVQDDLSSLFGNSPYDPYATYLSETPYSYQTPPLTAGQSQHYDNALLPAWWQNTAIGDRMTEGVVLDTLMAPGTAMAGGAISKAVSRITGSAAVANPVPSTLARAIPIEGKLPPTLGRAGNADVFVTAASDISGMNASQIATRLTIDPSPTGFYVIEFPTPSTGLATPILRNNPGFIGGGLTSGGAREFVIPNQPIPQGATIRIVR